MKSRTITELPISFRRIFDFRLFNTLQSKCFATCFLSNVNMVVSAPNGSGKTVLLELCMLKLINRFICEDGWFANCKMNLKMVYIAPSNALVQEKLRDWTDKFGQLGLSCLEMTEDSNPDDTRVLEADIILTTPERFDVEIRSRIGGLAFLNEIGLVLIDEVHTLNDPCGAALEAIVSRIKMQSRRLELKSSPIANVRFIAISATIPNLEDLGDWLLVPHPGRKRFGGEMRGVKLITKVVGFQAAEHDSVFEKVLDDYIFNDGKMAIVFCSTRKEAQEAAQRISRKAMMSLGDTIPFIGTGSRIDCLKEASSSCSDKELQSCIGNCVGYHHEGLSLKDRNLMENMFRIGDLRILCSTNTLAHGVNLPAAAVVIKSTQKYEEKSGTEYDRSTVLQMCGRAVRPLYNDPAMAIIMTREETVPLYENILNKCEIVESKLLSSMTEHLAAEIVQRTVPDITMAIEWVKCSYLYVRMKKNPDTYSVKKGISRDDIDRHMQDICGESIKKLSQMQMIWADKDGFLKPLEPGSLMTKYYLKFNTMKNIMEAQPPSNLKEALHMVCRAEELSWIDFQPNEDKGELKKRIQTRGEKIFVLVNDYLSGGSLVHDLSLTQDTNSICKTGCRIAKCMAEFFAYKKNYVGAMSSIMLAKSLHQKMWHDNEYLRIQSPGIEEATAEALHSMGIISRETLAEADPREIASEAGRKFTCAETFPLKEDSERTTFTHSSRLNEAKDDQFG